MILDFAWKQKKNEKKIKHTNAKFPHNFSMVGANTYSNFETQPNTVSNHDLMQKREEIFHVKIQSTGVLYSKKTIFKNYNERKDKLTN